MRKNGKAVAAVLREIYTDEVVSERCGYDVTLALMDDLCSVEVSEDRPVGFSIMAKDRGAWPDDNTLPCIAYGTVEGEGTPEAVAYEAEAAVDDAIEAFKRDCLPNLRVAA